MKNTILKTKRLIDFASLVGITNFLQRQKNIITILFTANPTANAFSDKVYLYPSNDICSKPEHRRPDWFCIKDYHVCFSKDLTD